MNEPESLVAKATSLEEQSDSVVVSFGAEWHELLLKKQFTAVIRKRVPKSLHAKWLYFHVNAPISAISARAAIRAIKEVTLPQAVKLTNELALPVADIESYFAGDTSVGCYELGQIVFPMKPLTIRELAESMVYHAPQSFFILSREAKTAIDRLAGFKTSSAKNAKTQR
jgi:predicted transcriptional regulator